MFHQISISLAGEKEIVRLVKSAYRFITFSDKMPYPREISVLTIYIMKYNIIVSQSQPYNLQYIPWETIKLKQTVKHTPFEFDYPGHLTIWLFCFLIERLAIHIIVVRQIISYMLITSMGIPMMRKSKAYIYDSLSHG